MTVALVQSEGSAGRVMEEVLKSEVEADPKGSDLGTHADWVEF